MIKLKINPITNKLDLVRDIEVSKADWNQNGFENRTDSSLSWNNANARLTIVRVNDFSYWIAGVKYTKTSDEFVDIDDTKEGIHAIYYDGSTLTSQANPTDDNMKDYILHKALVSIIYWDNTNSIANYVGEERHGKGMSPETHSYLHFIYGLAYKYGLSLSDMSVEGDGDSNIHAQFQVDAGEVADEDIEFDLSSVTKAVGLPIYYMVDSASWRRDVNAGYSVTNTGTAGEDRLAYNQYMGAGDWQKTEVTDGQFVLYHVFATTEKDKPMISIMGQNIYSTKSTARTGAEVEVKSLVLNNTIFPEFRPIATLIFQTKDSYSNAVQARIRTTDDGEPYVDWRDKTISKVAISTIDHNSFAGLQGGTNNEYYHLTSDDYDDLTDGGECSLHIHDDRYYTETEIYTILAYYYQRTDIDAWRNSVTQTEMGYLHGVTGDIQTQMALKSNIGHLHDDRYYTETELNAGQLNTLYYTKTELNAGQLNNLYYTETEENTWRNSVSQAEMGYLHGISSDIQTQLDARVAKVLFDANTFLYATADDTPQTKTKAQVMALLSGQATATFDFNTQNLTGVGTIECGDITVSGVRPVKISGAGSNITKKGNASGWAFGLHALGSSDTDRGGFGFVGNVDALTNYYIGTSYTDAAIEIFPIGNFDIAKHNSSTIGLKLGGTLITASAVELNYSDGVTSNIQTQLGARLEKNTFNIHTIIKADTDNNPVALNIPEQRILGRITGSNIIPLTTTQIRTLINVENNADVTDSTNVNVAGAVMNVDYNANTFLYATADNTPVVKTRAQVMALLSGQATAAFNFNSQDVIGVTSLNLSAFKALPSDEDLIAHWSLNDGSGSTATDNTGNGYDGTLQNMENADWVNAIVGKGLNFDGNNEYVLCGNTPITGAHTITAWVKPVDVPVTTRGIVSNHVLAAPCYGVSIYHSSTTLRVSAGDGAGNRPNNSWASVFSAGNWTFIALVYDGTKFTLYIDGKAFGATWTTTVGQNNTAWVIGRWDSSYDNYYFYGIINAVRVYTRDLIQSEIEALFLYPGGNGKSTS